MHINKMESKSASLKKPIFVVLSQSSFAKITAPFLVQLLSSVFAGGFIMEISSGGDLTWFDFHKSWCFWLMIVLSASNLFYFTHVRRAEMNIERFAEDEYCEAYMKHECLPALAKITSEKIKAGDFKAYEQAMNIVGKGKQ